MNSTMQIIIGIGIALFLVLCGISIFIWAFGYYKEVTEVDWYKNEYRRMKNLYEHE